MKITYDSEVDALSIVFIDTTVTTKQVAEGVAIDYAEDGRVAGIEILDALRHFGSADVLRRIEIENMLPAPATLPA
ncbi:MAG: DUF2283 domain-containing protein [Chloroflexi bacterium]|nr:DUF2283 domain-containing protein [Chloroflexota bacterium]